MLKKGNVFYLSLVVLVAVVALVVLFSGMGSHTSGVTGNVVKSDMVGTTANVVVEAGPLTPACTDSDNGINTATRGKVTYTDKDYATSFIDFCRSYDSSMLKEYYCKDGHADYQEIRCDNGCKDGACQ